MPVTLDTYIIDAYARGGLKQAGEYLSSSLQIQGATLTVEGETAYILSSAPYLADEYEVFEFEIGGRLYPFRCSAETEIAVFEDGRVIWKKAEEITDKDFIVAPMLSIVSGMHRWGWITEKIKNKRKYHVDKWSFTDKKHLCTLVLKDRRKSFATASAFVHI